MKPQFAPTALPLYAVGIILILISFSLFYQVADFGRQEKWHGFSYLTFSIVLFVGGVYALKAAHNADRKRAEDMEHRADAHASELEFWKTDIALQNIYEDSRMESMIRRTTQEVELLRLEIDKRMLPMEKQLRFMQNFVQQQELSLRQQYIEPAKQQGLSVDQYMLANEHWNRQLIDLEVRRRDIANIIEQSLEVEVRVAHQKVNRKLLQHAQELVIERRKIYDDKTLGAAKKPILDLYAANIMALVQELADRGVARPGAMERVEAYVYNHAKKQVKDAGVTNRRQLQEAEMALYEGEGGLVSTNIREKTRRSRSQNSNSRAGYPPTAGDDED
jgi:hypothetical protein